MSNRPLTKDERLYNGFKKWIQFFRQNPHRFATEYLQIPLFLFQSILIYMMDINNAFLIIASRGLGKSYLIAVYCCIRAILYPNSKIIVASATKGQAKLLISQKIDKELRLKYPNLAREIVDIKVGANESVVIFKNGSTIEAVVSNDNARGYRGHILIVDEFRMVKNDVIQKVLKPFLNVCRKPAFTSKKEYENYPLEENKEFYMSSAWYKQHYSWDKFKGFVKSMCRGEKFFACALNYRLAVNHNLLSESRVEAIRNEDDMNPITWDMEMEALYVGETEGALYKFDEINPCRTITKPFIPRSDQEWAMNKKSSLKKIEGEKRVIGFDVALMGRSNCPLLRKLSMKKVRN